LIVLCCAVSIGADGGGCVRCVCVGVDGVVVGDVVIGVAVVVAVFTGVDVAVLSRMLVSLVLLVALSVGIVWKGCVGVADSRGVGVYVLC